MSFQRTLVAACLLSAAPASAFAQGLGPGWLDDRARAEGPGFRVGNLELHPGLGLEAGYDSNVFFESADSSLSQPTGSAIFRISPHLFLSTLGPQRMSEGEGTEDNSARTRQMVQFQAGVAGLAYIFLEEQAQNNIGATGSFQLRVNPQGRFGFTLSDQLTRNVRPFAGRSNQAQVRAGRVQNMAALSFNARSPGGVFTTNFGYGFNLDYFEGQSFQFANSFRHQLTFDSHYRFLPRTSVFWDATVDYTDYYNATPTSPLAQSNNWRLRSRVGLNGAVTPRLSATVAAGYTATFLERADQGDFETALFLASLRAKLTASITLSAGFERDVQGSVTGNFRLQNRGYVDFQWLLGRAFLLGLNASVARLRFGDIAGTSVDPTSRSREDTYVETRLFAEYRFTDYLALNASFGYFGTFTDFEFVIPVDTEPAPIIEPAGFNKVEAWLGVRVFY